MIKTYIKSNPPHSLTVLNANVGNTDLRCRKVLNKLCYVDVEQRITDNIKALKPDLVTLQEVLAPWQCEQYNENNPKKVCFQSQSTSQIRRLFGPDFTIVCNTRNQFECIGLKKDIGDIKGCENGSLCFSASTTESIAECDNGFNISAATIQLNKGVFFDVVNFHPQSTSASCRRKAIEATFGLNGKTPLIREDKILLMGDFNFDPWRDKDESTILWSRIIKNGWRGQNFIYHSGIAEKDPPYKTVFFLFPKTSDFVVSNFASGNCYVLGETPGTSRLDGGKGTDHRAIYGLLNLNQYMDGKDASR